MAKEGNYNEKPFWESKTLWVNVIGLIIVVIQYFQGVNIPILSPELSVAILAILNIVLRFVTNQPVSRSIR